MKNTAWNIKGLLMRDRGCVGIKSVDDAELDACARRILIVPAIQRASIRLVFIIAALVFVMMPAALHAESYVNVKYLESQPGISVEYNWQQALIIVRGKAGEATIILNYPYVTSGKNIARIDTPPFIENGKLFISQMTSDKIMEFVNETRIAQATAVVVKVVTAKPANTPIPAPTKEAVVIATLIPEPTKEIIRVEESSKSNQRKLIVIDPGHGGNDPGAIGKEGLQEKDVVLPVAEKVERYLKSKGLDVLITRNSDKFITLKNRAYFANDRKADLFVSIHCNASPDRAAMGTRAYIYSRVASSKAAAEAAKWENKDVGAFEFLLNDLRKGAYEYLSIEAAGNIQHNLVSELKLKWEPTERAPFYVLANTNMPSVLVEIAFISNPKEEEKLDSDGFRSKVAEGIGSGVMQYLEKIK